MGTIFERASRKKLRFNTQKGVLSTEDLWDLPLLHETELCLNDLAIKYNSRVKEASEENFVEPGKVTPTDDKLKFEIVKHIIDHKVKAAQVAETRAKKRRQRDLVLQVLNEKENEELRSKSSEELRALLDDDDDDMEVES